MNSHPIEILESSRLLLRKVAEGDWLVLFNTITNNQFPLNLPLKEYIQTENDAQKWVMDAIQKWRESTRYTWTLCLRENPNLVVGQISITKRAHSSKWGIAFWIVPDYQNKGYAKEAVVALTEELKTKNDLWFSAGAAAWNIASNRVLIDSGFKKIQTHENGYTLKGKTISGSMNEYEKI